MKKIILTGVLIISMSLLAGCQTKEKETSTSPEIEVTATAEVTQEPEQTVEPTEEPEPTIEITEEPEVTEGPEATDEVTEEAKEATKMISELDWESCIADVKKELTDTEFFSYVNDIGVFVDQEEEKITLTAALDDSTDPSIALEFADTFIRRLNATAMLQNSYIKSASKDYYGGLYDTYSVLIGIAPASKINDDSQWFVYDAVAKGAHTKIKLQKQYR